MKKTEVEQKKQLLLDVIGSKDYKPLKIKEMAMFLQVPKSEREKLRILLNELVEEGKLIVSKKGKYKLPGEEFKTGIFCGTQRGFGFVQIEEGQGDIFIPENATMGALDKDKVQIVIKPARGKRQEGAVKAILEHHWAEVVGTFQKSKNYGFVIPDNLKLGQDIFIPKEKAMGAVTGHKVVAKITHFGSEEQKPEGEVIEILGHANDPGVDIESIVRAYDLPVEFPEEVMHQVERIPDEVNSKEYAGRLDLRDKKTVTIDGEDAKDLDDAITLEKNGDGYILGVHIADVTNYVTEDSPLDKEAIKRGTSVYLVNRVIPMLPHKLSNGICSLNEGEDRLALSCIMEIDKRGEVIGHKIAETLLRVDRRMTYTSVNKIVTEKDEEEMKQYEELVPMFSLMGELAELLRKKRKKRGSIDFDFPESKITVDEKGKPIDIRVYERNKATKIIEDFMLLANETVAEDFFWQEIPFLYRTHESPDPEKIQKLGIFINNFGYTMKVGNTEIHPKELQKLLTKVEDTPEEALITRLALRSMKQAKYTVTNAGHFGLSTKYYCHFTSPIRRYPDLQIHRIIKENLRKGLGEKRLSHYESILPERATQSCVTERRADEAEREVTKLKKVEYMKQFLGQSFSGVISGITAWGIYVELPNTVEGMVRVSSMQDDYYIYDETNYTMIGERMHRTYKLGQKVTIEVVGVDRLMRTIDFEFTEPELA